MVKKPKNDIHVAVVKNINNVVVNKPRNLRKYKDSRGFYLLQFFCVFKSKIEFRYPFSVISLNKIIIEIHDIIEMGKKRRSFI